MNSSVTEPELKICLDRRPPPNPVVDESVSPVVRSESRPISSSLVEERVSQTIRQRTPILRMYLIPPEHITSQAYKSSRLSKSVLKTVRHSHPAKLRTNCRLKKRQRVGRKSLKVLLRGRLYRPRHRMAVR